MSAYTGGILGVILAVAENPDRLSAMGGAADDE
jgi:hypothetical protein